MTPSLTVATLMTDSGTYQLPLIEIPLNESIIENATDVTTLDMNVYTDFINSKRVWKLNWAFLDRAQWDEIYNVYRTQFTDYKYPRLSIPFYGISNVACRMDISDKKVINVAGDVADTTITLRETAQQ